MTFDELSPATSFVFQSTGGFHASSRVRELVVKRKQQAPMSHSLVKYKVADNQDWFLACPPGSIKLSRPQTAKLSCSRRMQSSLNNGYWCALLSETQIIAEQPI